ncbi:MAG: hypothetical protein QXL01_07880, partial [Thermoplasmatales archaeon]
SNRETSFRKSNQLKIETMTRNSGAITKKKRANSTLALPTVVFVLNNWGPSLMFLHAFTRPPSIDYLILVDKHFIIKTHYAELN